MPDAAIVMDRFTCRFRSRTAVQGLSLTVPRGTIYGLVGPNGAGKTTTLKAVLNLLQPTEGSITVLGHDSVEESLLIRSQVGYVPELPDIYPWMTVEEILRFRSAFHPSWDHQGVSSLLKTLDLPTGRPISGLSRGMKAKVGLLLSLGMRPEILILDDPTSGLDAVIRREFLEAVIGRIQAEGGTVLMASHLLHELERVADRVAILHQGRLCVEDSLERLKSRFKKIQAIFPHGSPDLLPLQGLCRVERNARMVDMISEGDGDESMARLQAAGASSVKVMDMSLEEIFVEILRSGGDHA